MPTGTSLVVVFQRSKIQCSPFKPAWWLHPAPLTSCQIFVCLTLNWQSIKYCLTFSLVSFCFLVTGVFCDPRPSPASHLLPASLQATLPSFRHLQSHYLHTQLQIYNPIIKRAIVKRLVWLSNKNIGEWERAAFRQFCTMQWGKEPKCWQFSDLMIKGWYINLPARVSSPNRSN